MSTRRTVVGNQPAAVFPSAASELVHALADEGVQHLFINPGTDTAPVQEALAAARRDGTPHPRAVLCIHEFVALSAAMGHHFVSGTPQAVMVHVDAGTLNLGGALHNAQRNRVPVVVFAGRSPYATAEDVPGHRNSPIHWQQEQLDQQAVLRAFGKWTMEVPRGRELGGIVRRAFQVAQSDPKGPAYVMLPREALMEPGAGLARHLRPPRAAAPDPAALAEVARSLADADRPVIVTGRTGARPAAVEALVQVAELLGCPVLDHRDRLNFPPRHPLYAGDTPELLREADVVLLLDVEVPWVPAHAEPSADAVVLQIDVDPVKATMPSWSYPVDLALTADTALALPLLEAELRRLATAGREGRWGTRREQVTQRLADVRQGWEEMARSDEPSSAVDAMLEALNRALPTEAIVLEEAVTNRAAVTRQVVRDPGFYYGTGSPALGWATAGALGVKLAKPDSPVVAVCGDGSFNFSVPTAALWSAQKAGAPFVTVILNNRAYRASKLPVQRLYPGGAADAEDSFPETELSPSPDYVQLARAYGGDGEVVTHPKELAAALERCLDRQSEGLCSVIDAQLPT
ncbi:MAG: thiamine pyrophosphate-requiring protein [Streptosporangiales bacterium]|nr:thiamine pyrophosphate-requiring protein [Streptosporangiales bacterium]